MVMATFLRVGFWIMYGLIMVDAVVHLWLAHLYLFAVGALVLSPITFFVWPFVSGLWWLLVVGIVLYALSVRAGAPPITR
jgi:hypothetical protein